MADGNRRRKIRRAQLLSTVLLLLILALLFIPVKIEPHADTRIIADVTYRIYMVPGCFEQTEVTNNLRETVWEDVKFSDYKPESSCTEEALQPVDANLWIMVREWINPKLWRW